MIRLLLGSVLIGHGFVTLAIWSNPNPADALFDPSHSWLLGDARALALTAALLAGAGFVLTGVGYLRHRPWWTSAALASGLLGVALMLLYFNAWLAAGLAISATAAYAGSRARTPHSAQQRSEEVPQ
jgi:hypothetical protein